MDRYSEIDGLEDFWNRKHTRPRFSTEGHVFGHPFRMAANDRRLLEAARYSMPQFSRAPALARPPFQIQLVSNPERTAAPDPPHSLFDQIWYTGNGDWLMLHLGPWGQAYVDLARREAVVVVAPSLAARPDIISHSVLNTILLNFCLHEGYGMLHASCLVSEDPVADSSSASRRGRALLLMAPHNTGKSTTALFLILAGYRLLTDSMVHISPFHGTGAAGLLCGFPVGKIKLRHDMVPFFPEVRAALETEQVRDETKYTLDLRQLDPALVVEEAWLPDSLDLCLLSRQDADETSILPATDAEVHNAVLRNSLFFDQASVWERNLAQITPLIEQAGKYHLRIGRDPAAIVRAVDELWRA
ncbi:MAG: hypothetical protein ACK2UK_11460 [Candidatus Promineifilaceae bacterium]